MNQREAVMQVMEENGGYATLGYLYQHVLDVPDVKWETKTPFATMRRIVQDPRYFFKIRPGLWALNSFNHTLPPEILAQAKTKTKSTARTESDFDHTYYQGLLVEIGNLKNLQTFVPSQDKNRKFLEKPLARLISLAEIYPFTYQELVQRAQTIDVTWFNERKMPDTFFEVEHSTDIQNSLGKFVDLQDFNAQFRIVADKARQREYEAKIARAMFRPIATRVKFVSYDVVSTLHSKMYEYVAIASRL